MKTQLLTAVSILALAGANAAFAETEYQANTQTGEVKANADTSTGSVKEDIKQGWENTKEAVSDTAEKAADATSEAYENIKASVIGEPAADGNFATVTIDSRQTAAGMIGKPIYNAKNEKIATVKDIIVDANGDATMVVISDGGLLGFGSKLAAFDYGLVSQRQKDGDVIMPLSEETIKKAAEFSYDAKDAGKQGIRAIPAGSLSVATLLDGQIVNPKNETVAQVDNLSFRNGAVSQIIVAFDQTLGMGGKKAAVAYDNVKVIKQDQDGGNVDFQLSAAQTTQFENFKKTSAN